MLIYWLIFGILSLGAMLGQIRATRVPRLMVVICAGLPMALMVGLRWQIGPDWWAYADIFRITRLMSFDQAVANQDPGFYVLIVLLHQIDAPLWTLNLICGVTFVAGLIAFCSGQLNPWLSLLVAFPYLVVVVAMSGDRQALALGILFFALNAFERGQLNRFVVLAGIAALFHGSAMLIIPIVLLSYARNSFHTFLLLVAAALVWYYLLTDAFEVYAHRYGSQSVNSTGVGYRLAMNGFAAIIFLFFQRRFSMEEHQKKLWRNISILSLALVPAVLLFPSSTAIDRFLLYLFPLQFVIFGRSPSVLTRDEQTAAQLTFAVIAYAALIQVTFLYYGTFAKFYVPYRSIVLG